MARGRTPSYSDENAVAAVADVEAFLREKGLTPTGLARQQNISASAVLRALQADPPSWTPTLKKLDIFVKSQRPPFAHGSGTLQDQLRALQGAGSARATAAVLRAVADLLDLEAAAS